MKILFVPLLICGLILSGCTLNLSVDDIGSKIPTPQQILVTIDENTPVVTTDNVSTFPISGTCTSAVKTFSITSPPPTQLVTCTDNKWSAVINLSGEADGTVNIVTDISLTGSFLPVSFQVTKDTTAPTVSGVVIESGALVTNKATLAYVASGADISAVYLSESATCATGEWQDTGSGTVTPSAGDGLKTFYVKTKDSVGNISACALATTITIDRTAPVITGLADDASLRASKSWAWSCTDANGPCQYRHLITAATPIAPVGVYSLSANSSYTGTGIYHIGVQAIDTAGNESAVTFVQATLDASLPDLFIQNGAAFYSASSVTLNLTNLGTYDEVDISNSPACAGATTVPTAATVPWNLVAGEGIKKVYFLFRDTVNTVSTTCAEVEILIDSIAPTVTLTSPVASSFTTPSFTVTATFSENVYLFDATKVTVTNGVVSNVNGPALLGSVYTFVVTPSGQGAVTVQIAGSQVMDTALNNNTASAILTRTYDTVRPTVTLTSAAATSFNSSTISVDANFSESVTGFDLSDVVVTNGVASSLTGSGASYSFTITPSGQGVVTVSLAANKAQDAAGNLNTAATNLTRTYDTTAPTITGIADDLSWTKSKTWTWSCGETCTYRFVVDTNASTSPSGAYGATATATEAAGTGTYYLHVQAQDAAGNTSTVTHVSAKIDNTVPTAPTSITDGTALNSLTASPAISFTSGSDANSGVAKHQARVLLASDSSEVATWRDLASGGTMTGLSLTTNTSYLVEVRTVDAAGNVSVGGVSDGWIADTTPPLITSITLNGAATLSSSPTISWSAASDGAGGSGINRYELQVRASPSGTVMSAWTTLTSGNKVNSLTLTDGAQYMIAMRTVDNAGNISATMGATTNWTAVDYDPCADAPTAGMICAGGAEYVGKLVYGATATTTGPADHYMTTPGGCADVPVGATRANTAYDAPAYHYSTVDFTPACPGTADTVAKNWNNGSAYQSIPGVSSAPGNSGLGYGELNKDSQYGSVKTPILAAVTSSAQGGMNAAALYCDRLVYGGRSDWYLPNIYELHLIYLNQATLTGISGTYWSSSPWTTYATMSETMSSGNQANDITPATNKIRCVRKFQVLSELLPPKNPLLPNKGMYISLTETPVLTWTASPYGGTSGIDHYEVRIFRSSDNVAATAWTTLASGGQLTGLTLDDGEKYYYKVRMVAVDASISPEATSAKSWQAYAVDPCTGSPAPGTQCADDTFSIGMSGAYHYKTTPGNCIANGTCNGATDTFKNYWGTSGTKTSIISRTDGATNTTSLVTTYGALTLPFSPDGAKYCENLTFGGHTDWFLPAIEELELFWWNLTAAQRTTMGIATTGYYHSSSEQNHATQGSSNLMALRFLDGLVNTDGKSSQQFTRCVRKEAGSCAGTPANSECPGSVWTGGGIYLGSLSWGSSSVTTGTADRYMTTPGGCGEIPGGQIVATPYTPASDYPNADFTPTCSGTDALTRVWNDGSNNYFDITTLTNFANNMGTGYHASNKDDKYGLDNATAITAITLAGEGGYHAAALYCDKLVVAGFSDWYLPNRYELNLLWNHRTLIPGLSVANYYWSSTENSSSSAWYQEFTTGYQSYTTKTLPYRIRCVRKF